MHSMTPFTDAGDCLAEACGWLKDLISGTSALTEEENIEQVQYHLARASDALHDFEFEMLHEKAIDLAVYHAYEALGTLSREVLTKAQAGYLTVSDMEKVRLFIESDPEFCVRAASERDYLASLPDEDPTWY